MPFTATPFVAALVAGFSAGAPPPLTIACAVISALFGAALTLKGLDVDVGPEGVTLRWLGRTKFVPYASIQAVTGGTTMFLPNGGMLPRATVCFHLFNSKRVLIDAGECGNPLDTSVPYGTPECLAAEGSTGTPEWLRKQIIRSVSERFHMLEEHRQAPSSAEQWLARKGQPVEAWLGALARTSGLASESYRTAPIDPESLWRVLENPAADPSARAGAAVLLRAKLEASDMPRARVAVERCVSPRLRVALERTLIEEEEGGEAERLKALAEVDETLFGRGGADTHPTQLCRRRPW